MTASTISGAGLATQPARRSAGLRALLRKDWTEWRRGRRAWIVLAISVLFMALSAANSWILVRLADGVGTELPPDEAVSLVALDNVIVAVGSQIFILAAIFAVGALIVREREAGTLAWVASKPVSRSSIWLSKWISSSASLVVLAALVPLAVTAIVATVLYGPVSPVAVIALGAGVSASVVFYTAVGLTAGTILPSQPAIIASGFAVFAIVPAVVGILPVDVTPFLPSSILGWTVGLVTGAEVGVVTPIAWLVGTALFVGVAVRQMGRLEL